MSINSLFSSDLFILFYLLLVSAVLAIIFYLITFDELILFYGVLSKF